jgi:hypothetical protein
MPSDLGFPPSDSESDEDEGRFTVEDLDWRLAWHSTLAKDSSDGRYKAGALAVKMTLSKNRRGDHVGFQQPSAAAMALSIAHSAASLAMELQQRLEYGANDTDGSQGASVNVASTSSLFNYFEQCMVAVTFSFQALEAYGNSVIAQKVEDTYPFSRKRGEVIELTAIELERQASTEQKLAEILPKLLNVSSPRGKTVWQNFKLLKEKRDATIHIKSTDQSPKVTRPENLDRTTLFIGFLDADILSWPKSAVQLIHYFARRDMVAGWLEHELERYDLPKEVPK